MQTFLPLPGFDETARVLDYRRLGKQRVEAWQILRAITSGGGWRNHPAVKMWTSTTHALALYGVAICSEWRRRGYDDGMLGRFEEYLRSSQEAFVAPFWLGDYAFHASHRSNLLRKDPVWYGQFGWSESADIPYVWPVGRQT